MSSANDQSSKLADSTAGEKDIFARLDDFRVQVAAVLYRKTIEFYPELAPAVTPDHLDDSPMNTTNPNKVT